ncbi:MAG: dienelactone hydrolase family protein [Gemmataceae bacterium]|nr:dienelactone hydrolase family protein [Gemmataceae bacterium]MDW8265490.1 dienelactone hydrolase family protein [Gemmataceae bacterium]
MQTKTVPYKAGQVDAQGFVAWDETKPGPRPGVLVVHEWWGLNDYARERCRQLAGLGYVAFAADLYGSGKTTNDPKEAGAWMTAVQRDVTEWRRRVQAALAALQAEPACDATKVAAIGYCFGGATALQLAYTGADLKAVATFHAALPTPTEAEARAIKARLLICHGADDGFIPADAITAFRAALDKAGVPYQFVAYPGAVHGFTVPNADQRGIPGIKYNKAADEASWQALKSLLSETLR